MLNDTRTKWPTQYGELTNREWVEQERERLARSGILTGVEEQGQGRYHWMTLVRFNDEEN